MDILDRITDLLGNTEQQKLTDYLHLKKTAYSDWKAGKSKSYRKYLIEIAQFFNVSIDYLVYGTEKNSPAEQLTADEQRLLTYFNKLNDVNKGVVIGRAETLAEQEQSEKSLKETSNTILIDFYDLPVSAGTGVFLDDCARFKIETEENALTSQADFALRISGDSMEPKFHDGDMVLVKEQPTVAPGEIGIFLVDGKGYIKQLGTNCLISLNPDYEDISLHEYDSVYCKGKVIGTV